MRAGGGRGKKAERTGKVKRKARVGHDFNFQSNTALSLRKDKLNQK